MSWTRRAFLGGAGVTLALPWLPSLGRAGRATAADTPPTRLLVIYVPNGFRMDLWRPQGTGTEFTLGPSMASLADLQDDLLVISGLDNASGRGDRPGDHARGTATFLTCSPIEFEGVHNGISMDQVAAQALGDLTPFRSLELGAERGGRVGLCDSGYACPYTQSIAWAGPSTPLPKITDPQILFDRLFAGTDAGRTAEERARRAVYRTSVLDAVKEQARSLQASLSGDDRMRLDEYLTGVRELERRASGLGSCGAVPLPPDEVTIEDRADVILDLAVSALACDLTRVATFMLGNAGSNQVYSFLDGVSGAHHEVSHHQNQTQNLDQLAVIDAWEVERVGRVLRRLKNEVVGDGSLLDHTAVLFSSEISDGNRHNHDDLPVLVAGGAGGAIATGRHLVVDREPIADLHIGLLDAIGVPVSEFGDGSRVLPGLAG